MRNKKVKKVKSRVLRYMRDINTNVLNDDLWRGRFYVRMYRCEGWEFSDHSGAELAALLEFIDLKTGESAIKRLDAYTGSRFIGADLFEMMNKFIMDDCQVWEREGQTALRNDKTIYRSR